MIGQFTKQAVTAGVIRRAVQVQSVRNNYPYDHRLLVTPPRQRIGFGEKVFWGTFISLFIVSVPAWIIVHHREYGGAAGGDE